MPELEKTLQERFFTFVNDTGREALPDLEVKCLLALYAAADPQTGLTSLSVSKVGRSLGLRKGGKMRGIVRAFDNLTALGIIEIVTPGNPVTGVPAVKKLVFGKNSLQNGETRV